MSEVKVPEGYKQTEAGIIPEDWEVKDIGETLTIKHGKDQKQVESAHGQYPIFGTGGQMGWANDFLYDKPSVLIGRKGSINKPRYINVPFWTVDTLFYSQVHNGYNEKFMFYKFCLIDWTTYNEASGVPSLNARTISNVKVSVPKKQEQTAIATALSDVDNLIQSLEKLIAKKEVIKTGTMQQLLTGKTRLPDFATREDGSPKGFKQTELGQIPEDWDLVELRDLLSYEQPTKYIIDGNEFLEVGTTPVLTAGKSFILGYTEEAHGIYRSLPTIIFDDFTTATQFVNFPFKVKSSAMKILKPKSTSVPIQLIYLLLSNIDYKVGDHKRHWISEFSSLKVRLPNSSIEQTAIATTFSDMDAEIQALQQRLDKTRVIKQGMMQQLLTGKVRLAH
ncbi:restriction endonuclease subunit S [uncultured Psychrobacter sp.]|uniref:restriction endonuclease subunit S n=1 Tax=uncultured Psychrobacter sp. TaxID=259303 RepID=UPI002632C7DA|nr:restriction endonuclease subunit S [uncultured Psychrobacter sp.]